MPNPPIATPAQFRAYLDKLPDGADPREPATTALITDLLARAQGIIERYIRFGYSGYTTATQQVVQGFGSSYLILPPHELGSITQVTTEAGQVIPADNYTEDQDGNLYLSNTTSVLGVPTLGYLPNLYQWLPGRYLITGNWGWGTAPPEVVEVCLEIAVNLWREKDKGAFTDAIGVEASGEVRVGYQRGLTNRQEMILKLVRQQYQDNLPVVIG